MPDGPGQVRTAAFSFDNRVLATGNLNEPVALHDLVGRTSRSLDDPLESTTAAACLAYAPDGATLAVGQQDGQITLWDSFTGCKLSTLFGHADFVASLAFSQDGTTIASSGGDRAVRVWDVRHSRERFAIQSSTRTFGALSISPDGRLLALGDRVNPAVRIWDLTSGRESESLEGAKGAVVAVAVSPDGSTLAAADLQGFVTFWDVSSREIHPNRVKHSGVHTLAFAPDGRALATGGFDGIDPRLGLSGRVSGMTPRPSVWPAGDHLRSNRVSMPSILSVWIRQDSLEYPPESTMAVGMPRGLGPW